MVKKSCDPSRGGMANKGFGPCMTRLTGSRPRKTTTTKSRDNTLYIIKIYKRYEIISPKKCRKGSPNQAAISPHLNPERRLGLVAPRSRPRAGWPRKGVAPQEAALWPSHGSRNKCLISEVATKMVASSNPFISECPVTTSMGVRTQQTICNLRSCWKQL